MSTEDSYCEWSVNVRNCVGSEVHVPIEMTYLITSAVSTVSVIVTMTARLSRNKPKWHFLLTNAVDSFLFFFGLAAFTAVIHTSCTLYGGYTNWTQPYIMRTFSYMGYDWGLITCLFAMMHSVPNAYMDRKGTIVHTLLPPAWVFYTIMLFQIVSETTTVFSTANLLGSVADSDGFDVLASTQRYWPFIVMGCNDVFLAIGYWYFTTRLIRIIQLNEANVSKDKRSRNSATSKAVRRIQHFLYIVLPLLVFYGVGVLFLGVFFFPAAQNNVAAPILHFIFGPGLGMVTSIVSLPLLYVELSGRSAMIIPGNEGSSSEVSRSTTSANQHTLQNPSSSSIATNSTSQLLSPSELIRNAAIELSVHNGDEEVDLA